MMINIAKSTYKPNDLREIVKINYEIFGKHTSLNI